MTTLQTKIETWIDEAAAPKFSALKLHQLANEIELSTILTDDGKEVLQRRIRLKFSQRNAAMQVLDPCGLPDGRWAA